MGRGSGGGSRSGGGVTTYYHGTSEAAETIIKKEGLTPGKSGGGDDWLKKSGWGDRLSASNRRVPSIFLTSDKNLAEIYANRAAEISGSKPVVLKVKVPNNTKILKDEEDSSGIRIEKKIPKSWIDR